MILCIGFVVLAGSVMSRLLRITSTLRVLSAKLYLLGKEQAGSVLPLLW